MAKSKRKAVAKSDSKKIGHYAFIAGIVVAIVVALIPQLRGDPATWVLVILGVLVGLMNVTAKEVTEFLVAALVLLISFGLTTLTLASLHTTLGVMWGNVITFIAPAAIVVAIKAIYVLAEK